jgi:presequence protease
MSATSQTTSGVASTGGAHTAQSGPVTHGFELLRDQDIPELRTRARLYRHVKTGAELLSLENDDENKVFGVAFRTPVSDSTGVPHILEHSVLGGSRKYPVKEPFNELIKGSLKTFLNAMTYPDKTVYPIASTNLQDFYNLADVYMDAVFHPRLGPDHLEQEGWRIEPESLSTSDGADTKADAVPSAAVSGANGPQSSVLTYKGIVLNEMRGQRATPEYVLYQTIQESLFPDSSYRHSSGGEPGRIPELTYEQFKRFHQTYYHPSNARIFFYGDGDPERRLAFADEYLREFDRIEPDSSVSLQPRFDAPRRVTGTFAVGPEAKSGKTARFTVNWLLEEVPGSERALTYHALEEILVGNAAAPLRKALIDSGLGEALAGGGLNDGIRQWTFSTGLRGIDARDAEKVEQVVFDTLRTLATEGIDRETVASAVNTIEFDLRENNTGQFPRGLSLMLRALHTWLYDGDPLAPLAYEAPLAALKRRLESGERVFETLIQQVLLDNHHRTTVLLTGDPEQSAREEAAERERLAQLRANLSDEEIARLSERAAELKRLQEAPDPPEKLALVPRLQLSDLDRQNKTIPIAVSQKQDARLLYHDLFTNGIVYFDIGFDLHTLAPEDLPYAYLFGRALVEIGTTREDFVRLSQRIGRDTGGIAPTLLTTALRETETASAWLFLRGKALAHQANALLDVLHDVLLEVKLDNQDRFRQMVREHKARHEASLIPNGHAAVNLRLAARFNEAGWADEQLRGVSNLLFTRALAEAVENDWPRVLEALERIRRTLIARGNAICNVTLDQDNWSRFEPLLDSFLAALPAGSPARAAWPRPQPKGAEAMTVPGQVNFVGKAANLYELGYTYSGASQVVTGYLGKTWLWEQVRVRSGAYGAFAGLNRRSGLFAYLSYRDPNLLGTLEKFDASARYLRDLDLSEDELTKAIIGTISSIDAYQLPDAKGWTSLDRHLAGDSEELLQVIRDQVLGTTAADFRAFADVLEAVRERGQVAVLGSESAVSAAAKERPNWLDVWSVGL